MVPVLRTRWFWITAAIVLPIALCGAMALILAVSPGLRVKVMMPWILRLDPPWSYRIRDVLQMESALSTPVGFKAFIRLSLDSDERICQQILQEVFAGLWTDRTPAMDPDSLTHLRHHVTSPNPCVAGLAIKILAMVQDTICMETVLERSRGPAPPPLDYAILTYLGLHDPPAMDVVIQRWLGEGTHQEAILDAWARFPDRATVLTLLQWTAEGPPRRAKRACSGLCQARQLLAIGKNKWIRPRIGQETFQGLIATAIVEGHRPLTIRQHLAIALPDHEKAFPYIQEMLRETDEARRIIELMRHALVSSNPPLADFSRTIHSELRWRTDSWHYFDPAPTGHPPPIPDPILLAVKAAILRSTRITVATAVCDVLKTHIDEMTEPDRLMVLEILGEMEGGNPRFSF